MDNLTPLNDFEQTYTIDEFAEIVKVDRSTITRWIKRGALAAIPLPSLGKRTSYRIPYSEVQRFLGQRVIETE